MSLSKLPSIPDVYAITPMRKAEGPCLEFDESIYSRGCHKHVHGWAGCGQVPVVACPPSAEPPPVSEVHPAAAPQSGKGKRKRENGEEAKRSKALLSKTFTHKFEALNGEPTVSMTNILPEYVSCASCKQAKALSLFINLNDNKDGWTINKSCSACCEKGLRHYQKRKRVTEHPPANVLGDKWKPVEGGWEFKTQAELAEEFITLQRMKIALQKAHPEGESTLPPRKQKTVQGAKRRIPAEFDHLYELQQ